MADLIVVEDDPAVSWTLTQILELEGHTVRMGGNGLEGLTLISARKPDLVLADIEMPILSGPEMAYRLFVANCGSELIPIVLLSGFPDLKLVAGQIGTPYYLAKPYSLEDLLNLVSRALKERTPPTYNKGKVVS
jgi:DNA-binding NtrC family response regulator